jgi:hypothetical protein
MKKSVLLKSVLAVMVFIFAVQITMAGIHDPKKTNDLSLIIKKHVSYPAYAQENNMTGFVVVAFKVGNDGKIVINQINSNQFYFQDYVINKLKELVLKDPKNYQDNNQYYYRFDFQLLKK